MTDLGRLAPRASGGGRLAQMTRRPVVRTDHLQRGRLLAAAAVGQPAGPGRTRSRRGCRRYRRPRQRLLRGDQFDAANAPYRVVQRRPVVCDQGQRCVVERSFESAPTAMDRMAAVGRRSLGGQGRPSAAVHERPLFGKPWCQRREQARVWCGTRCPSTRAVTSIHCKGLTSHPSQFQSLNGTPGVAGCGASGLTRRSQLLVVGRPERAARTKANSSSNAALTPPLCVIPG